MCSTWCSARDDPEHISTTAGNLHAAPESVSHHLAVRLPPRHQALPRRLPSRLFAPKRVGLSLSRRRCLRRLGAEPFVVLAPATQRHRSEAPSEGAKRDEGGLHSRQPRRVRAGVRSSAVRRHHGDAARHSHPRGRAAASGTPRRRIRRGHPLRPVAVTPRLMGLQRRVGTEPLVQHGSPPPRLSILVALKVPEAAGQARGSIRREVRRTARAGSRPMGGIRRHLRAHSPRRIARDRR